MRRRIDQFIKDKLEGSKQEYNAAHWSDMRVLLDNERRNRQIGFWYWVVAVFIIASLSIFFLNGLSNTNKPSNNTKELAELSSPKLKNATDEGVAIVQLNVNDGQSTASKPYELLRSEASNQNNYKDTKQLGEEGSIEKLPVNESSLSTYETVEDDVKNLQALDEQKDINAPPLKDVATAPTVFQLFNEGNGHQKNFGVGVGWHVENSWGWSTGAFASLDYRFHRIFSINVRPGITFRSNQNGSPEALKDLRNNLNMPAFQGDLEQLESYAVDLPLSVQFHKQRHLVSLGGGVHYAFMQKIAVNESRLADLGNLTNTNTLFFESTVDKSTWVQPGQSLFPFAEFYYSYLLTPSFELGGRSRFYMPDDLNMNNRLNFAAQLVWHIN
jgi:hypothetical protein